jgi:hypothetical protein
VSLRRATTRNITSHHPPSVRLCRPDRLLPTLLAFDQASALEAELGGFGPGMFGSLDLTGKLLARVDFFEAALNRAHGPFELARRARQATGVADAMARALDEGGLQPTSCLLGSAMEEQELGTVGMRDMGANTRAATSQECSPPAPRGGGRGGACSAGA